jgi:hypothetical protein
VRRLTVLLAAVALLAAGCGGGGKSATESNPPLTKQQYQAKLTQIESEIQKQLGGSSTSIDKMTDAQGASFVTALHTFASRLQAVNPPPAVASLHRQLIQAVNDLADEFPGLLKKLRGTKDPSAALTTLFGAKAIQEALKLGAEFKKAGYQLNLSGA